MKRSVVTALVVVLVGGSFALGLFFNQRGGPAAPVGARPVVPSPQTKPAQAAPAKSPEAPPPEPNEESTRTVMVEEKPPATPEETREDTSLDSCSHTPTQEAIAGCDVLIARNKECGGGDESIESCRVAAAAIRPAAFAGIIECVRNTPCAGPGSLPPDEVCFQQFVAKTPLSPEAKATCARLEARGEECDAPVAPRRSCEYEARLFSSEVLVALDACEQASCGDLVRCVRAASCGTLGR